MTDKTIIEVLSDIQSELKAPKNQKNKFGNYNYRSNEDILEALKPILKKHKAIVILQDEVVCKGDAHQAIAVSSQSVVKIKDEEQIIKSFVIGGEPRYYVEATATLMVGDKSVSTKAYARESKTKKGMDEAQITGSASSYARKYALNGLFAIDDNKDPDTTNLGDK